MIFSTPEDADRLAVLHPLFPQLFAYLRANDPATLAAGRHDLDGERLFAIVEHAQGRPRAQAPLEAHRRYIDLQLVLSGEEAMGWRSLGQCRQPCGDHDAARDIRFFDDAPAAWIDVPPGHFCIFFPEDAHAPLAGSGPIHKVIFKIAAAS